MLGEKERRVGHGPKLNRNYMQIRIEFPINPFNPRFHIHITSTCLSTHHLAACL